MNGELISKENFEPEIKKAVADLFNLADRYCRNRLSPECFFIVSDFSDFTDSKGFENRKLRNKINSYKTLSNMDSSIEILKQQYADLYGIVLYVFKAERNKTIIEIECYRKSDLDHSYFEKVKNNQPMLHAKIQLPLYCKNGEKFDVNWRLVGWRHRWNMFIYTSFTA